MNPQNAIVLGCLLTAFVGYLLVLWCGSRIGHGVVFLAIGCLGFVAMEQKPDAQNNTPLVASTTDIVLDAIRNQMELNNGQR